MKLSSYFQSGFLKPVPLIVLIFALLLSNSALTTAQAIVVTINEPLLYPAYNNNCSQTYWYPFTNNLGYTTYLTLNTNNPQHSTNMGEWVPTLPQDGYYQVEAYIAGHGTITWCNQENWQISHDTTQANYSIHSAYGETTRSLSQYPLANQWLDLGEYYFYAGNSGYISLSDLNNEAEYSTTVSFSAMRFTFTRSSRPNAYLPVVRNSIPSVNPPPDTGIIQAQGFDGCTLPSTSQMQTWWLQSPYKFYALYMGGISLYHKCNIASSAWVNTVHQQGWSFVPIWVGPQAPCYTYLHPMSSDPTESYQQGRQEAQSASAAAETMGLTNNGEGGTIIYYDMEAYGGNTQCRQAVSAFMNGWVERLHELGNFAGGYGVPCSSYLTDWSTIANVPDDVWPAYWNSSGYNPNASVFNLPCLSDTLWVHHQRIHQYAGELSENWGGVSLSIDINVADGIVAMPTLNPTYTPSISATASIEEAGWVSAEQGWLVSANRLYWTNNQGESWMNISPAPIRTAVMLPSGQAWALSTQNEDTTSLYLSPNWGATWKKTDLTLPSDAWYPIQLQFTSPTNGWMVMKKVTSQAFNIAILLKTNDGGQSWETYDLPIAGKIDFTSLAEGRLIGSTVDELYTTVDGGLTWSYTRADESPLTHPTFPEGTIISGWGANGLGWSASSVGNCKGDKSSPNFSCQISTGLWQTLDGGKSWESIPLPGEKSNQP